MINPNLQAKDRIYSNLPEERKRLMKEFILSTEEHEQVLEDIKKSSYAGKTTKEEPKFILVLGQTGSGKTNLTSNILRNNSNLVVIDTDKYKAFRKDTIDIQRNYPVEFAYLTAPDAYQHRDEMLCDAMENKYDILMECAPTEKDGMFVNLDDIKKSGYNVELNVLAVSGLNSLLSIHERYEAQLTLRYDAAKLTDISRHDDSFTSLQKVIKDVQNDGVKINIYQRGIETPECPQLLYSSSNNSKSFSSPLEALIFAQLQDEKRTITGFDRRYIAINTQMFSRNAPIQQLRQLEQVRERYDKYKTNQNEK